MKTPLLFALLCCTGLAAHSQSAPGNALNIAGTINYVAVSHTVSFNSMPITVMAWVNTTAASGQQGLVNKYVANSLNGWNLYLLNGRVRAWYFVSDTRNVWGGGNGLDGGFIADGLWHHIAFVVDSAGGRIYVDGVLRASQGWTGASGATTTTQEVRIGSYPNGNSGFIGSILIDDVSVWNDNLNTGEIQVSMNGGLPGSGANRLAYYPCDESGGTTVADLAPLGGNNNGTWVGTVVFTPVLPSVQTLAATSLNFTQATLNLSANPNRSTIAAGFQWGITTNYGNAQTAATFGGPASTTNQNHALVVAGLVAGTTYHFRAFASNSATVVFSSDQTFRTLGLGVDTLPASGMTATSATLNGVVNPGGANAFAWFEWGLTTNYGNVTPPQAVGSGTSDINVSQLLTGLSGGTHHFRVVASNSFGVVHGGNHVFTLPVFTFVTNFPGLTLGGAAWGDSDNDGRLDLLLAGTQLFGSFVEIRADVWRNSTNGFVLTSTELPEVTGDFWPGAVAWGDFDRDGRLDIALSGSVDGTPLVATTEVWANSPSGFVRTDRGLLPKLMSGTIEWADCDSDGQLDLLLAGWEPSTSDYHLDLFRNVGGFSPSNVELPPLEYGPVKGADYDNDGDIDLLVAGKRLVTVLTELLRQTAGAFTNVAPEIAPGLPPVYASSAAWGDFDNDGRLDFVIAGNASTGLVCQVWRNTGVIFTNVPIPGLRGVSFGSVAWGDFDNDGWLDLLVTGKTNMNTAGAISEVWRNTGSGFTNINAGLPGVSLGTAAWGDYDNDGRLDILLTGTTNGTPSGGISQVWRNQTLLSNTPPTAPSGLNVTLAGPTAVFSWNAAHDAETPAGGLSYNLRVGTTPGGGEIVNPMASTTGQRRLPQLGNAQMAMFRHIHHLPAGQTLYWSVQAVDTAFAGGPFAPEQSFVIGTVFTPTNGVPVPGDQNGDGIVSQDELAAVLENLNGNGVLTESDLNLVLSNYFANSPFLQMTNVAGLGGTNVTFALTNDLSGAFSVEFSTDLADWHFLGPAMPCYVFTDTNAPAQPQRYYRLRWP
ncbi:MAG TPA: hypothetical protein GYA07_11620 [Verrucomicrobia bacterium]|nr:hypothetical protein [Verrucomicrobiota bacterium]HOP97728.1 FG-GAP-like repeat-containing protein [Verrucomicrobiota bacterium]